MKNLIKRLDKAHQELEDIRNSIQEKVNSLPDNPRISRINDVCFTMSSHDLTTIDKDGGVARSNFSAGYHNFSKQYWEIGNIIKHSFDIANCINKIIENGRYNNGSKFHPDVVKNLKGVVNGRKNMRSKT